MLKQAWQSLTSPEDLQSQYEAHVLLLARAMLLFTELPGYMGPKYLEM